MELSFIMNVYREQYFQTTNFITSHQKDQKQALNAIVSCRTVGCGEIQAYCSDCDQTDWFYHSCGHRSCPKCQHHVTTSWLNRQRQKLLPVDYFLVTFTLPAELRSLARKEPKAVYDLLFQIAAETLLELGANPKFLGGKIGITGALHTQSRNLDYHPHVHFIVPGIAFNPDKKICIQSRNRFLIPGLVLDRLFRGKFLNGLKVLGFSFPTILYQKEWVVDCKFAGMGEPALKYLSRYLYRGVLSEKNIISHQDGQVTYKYINSTTKLPETRTMPGPQFMKLILQHVLPKGFRRVRDYGFLHGNAKKTLIQLQLLLQPKIRDVILKKGPPFHCRCCGKPMEIIAVGVFRSVLDCRSRSPTKH